MLPFWSIKCVTRYSIIKNICFLTGFSPRNTRMVTVNMYIFSWDRQVKLYKVTQSIEKKTTKE